MSKINIEINQLTRVEGHGKLVIQAADGKVEAVRWEVTEAPRFFEMMLRGRPWHDAHVLASRICGICSVSHQLASLQATEAAFGLQPSEQTILLRKLLYAGEVIESHTLHLFVLAGPDFAGAGSIFPLIDKPAMLKGLKLKRLGNELMEIIGGRSIHPQATAVNGFGRLPRIQDLLLLQKDLQEALPNLGAVVDLYKNFQIPDFSRETEFISLKNTGEYAFIWGDIASTDTGVSPVKLYEDVIKEFVAPPSTAKFARHVRDSFAVGALARFNLNYNQLRPRAKEAANEMGLKPVCYNPFMNTLVQLVEVIHEVEESLDIVEQLLKRGVHEEENRVEAREGRGISAVEAPRGLLIYDYTYNQNGFIIKANCVIPTNLNHANIQKDLEALVSSNVNLKEDQLRLLCEMLVRSYDPCISCSTH
jgi:sulfhydrogenase subunit alpha